MSKLVGGSSGEPVRGGNVPFFYPEVKAFEPSSKNSYGGRILPGFVFDDSGTPTDLMSITPYRDVNSTDPQTGKEKFTSWYFSLKGYKFTGKEKRQFLSPLTLHRVDKRGIDPLFDCYLTARTSKDRKEWYSLTEKPKDTSDPKNRNAVLENFRVFGAINVLQDLGQGKFENRICVVTTAGMTDLKEQLDRYTPLGDTPIDPDWPRYLFGDVTSPRYGLWFSIKEAVFNNAGMRSMMFVFSQQKDRLAGHSQWPIDINTPWGQEVMRKRYNIADTDKVTRVASSQEILDFIVGDGFLPQELIHAACSDHWSVPAGHVNRTFSPPPAQPTSPAPAYQPPVQQPPAQQAHDDGDLGPVATHLFWVSLNGQTVPKPVTGAQLRGMVTSMQTDLLVCLTSNPTDWKPASAFGIVASAPTPPQAPQPPKPPTAPTGPSAPVPPSAPTPPQAPASPPRSVAPPPPTGYAPPAAPPTTPPPPAAGGFAPPPPPMGMAAPTPQQPPAYVPPSPPSAPYGGSPPAPSQVPPSPGGGPMVQQAGSYPTSPLHQQAPPQAPAPAPVPPTPTAPAPANTVAGGMQPLSKAEYEELMTLEKKWESLSDGTGVMDPQDMHRYASLSDRYQALKQAGVAPQ